MTAFLPAFMILCLFTVCVTPECQMFPKINALVDECISPCDNFYEFACGNWKKLHSVSEMERNGGTSVLAEARKKMWVKLKTLLETQLDLSEPDVFQFAISAYGSCMDLETIEASDAKPLKDKLHTLCGWPVAEGNKWSDSEFDWLDMLIEFRNLGFKFNLFYFNPTVQEENASHHAVLEWEIMDEWQIKEKMEELSPTGAYFSRMQKSARMLGANLSASNTELSDALNFEKELIKILPSFLATDGEGYKTRKTVTQLEKLIPQFPWRKLFRGMFNIEPQENEWLTIEGVKCFSNFTQLIRKTSKRTVANYMIWKAVEQSLPFLSNNWTLLLVNSDMPRKQRHWKQCLNYVNQPNTLRDAIDSYYARQFFGSRSKESAIEVVQYVQREYINMLERSSLDKSTKEHLLDKARNLDLDHIGFSDRLLNETYLLERYENIDFFNKSYLEVDLHLRRAYTDYRFGKLRKPITKNDFENHLAVTSVSAYISRVDNAIEIPVGFLELLFHKDRPQYLNFGALGRIAGHEMVHRSVFSYSLLEKILPMGWPLATKNQYLERTLCFVNQYDNYMEENGMKINGTATEDENIADTEGHRAAYGAYQTWVEEHGNENLLCGLKYTQNQLFWLSGAIMHCAQYTSNKLAEQIVFKRHSTDRFRVIGPMSNIPEFSSDFNCPYDSPMNRIDKCSYY